MGRDKLLQFAEYVKKTPKVRNQPPFLEIGTRSGGSALMILKVIELFFEDTLLLTVDPYGNKPFSDLDYTFGEDHFVAMKKLLANYVNHIHYYMTSEEFIKMACFSSADLWYKGERRFLGKQFSFILLDGSHDEHLILYEIQSLYATLIPGGWIAIDDVNSCEFQDKLRGEFKDCVGKTPMFIQKEKANLELVEVSNEI